MLFLVSVDGAKLNKLVSHQARITSLRLIMEKECEYWEPDKDGKEPCYGNTCTDITCKCKCHRIDFPFIKVPKEYEYQ